MMKISLNSVSFFLVFVSLFLNCAEAAHAADKKLDKSNFTTLGLVIGDCTSQDIYSKLGPGIPFKEDANPDLTQVCYVSDRDETLILFYSEYSQCFRLKVMSQKKKFYKWHFCEKSPLVSKHLATASGIKLGMSKSRLKAILGTPRNESKKNLNYAFEWKQKMSKTEFERVSQYIKDVKKNPYWTVKATIRAEFSDAGLISFDVSKISQ
jgi:hypothetical protein